MAKTEDQLIRHVLIKSFPLRTLSTNLQGKVIIVTMAVDTIAARCPDCHSGSRKVHSNYIRRPVDLSWGAYPVRIHLQVRRFWCFTVGCPRTIFSEQVIGFVDRYARRTKQLNELLTQIALRVGGSSGADIAEAINVTVSSDTLIRICRRRRLPTLPTPRVLGVDDWAFKKGARYGTILCDLERHRVVDLLPDREAATFAQWLREHPGVEIISRDRAGAYAEGARVGAPHAIQIADRWHLFKNLGDVMKRVVLHERAKLQILLDIEGQSQATEFPNAGSIAAEQPTIRLAEMQARGARDTHYRERYDRVHALANDGMSIMGIKRSTSLSRKTIRALLSSPVYPGIPQRANTLSSVTPFIEQLRTKWNIGVTNVKSLFDEIRKQGFTGSYAAVWRFTSAWPRSGTTEPIKSRTSLPAVFDMSRLLSVVPDLMNPTQSSMVDSWCARNAVLKLSRELALDFGAILRTRSHEQLPVWIAKALNSCIVEYARFANGLTRDIDAVTAALKYPWSNGQVEGQVQRLKTLKRQMYGRAGIDLLKARLIWR